MPDTITDVQKRAAEANEKLGADARKRGEEIMAKRVEVDAERGVALGERERLASEAEAVERVLWPYYGLFPEPAHVQLQVIPAGMWRYQVPITPALESMVPPSPEADPNYLLLLTPEERAKMQADAETEAQAQARARGEVTFVRAQPDTATAARAQAATQHANKAQHS